MKIVIEGGMYFDSNSDQYEWSPKYKFFAGNLEGFSTYVPICAYSLEADIPDDFDPRGQQIEMLEKRRSEITAAYQAALTEIAAQISKLQAIEYTP